MQMKHGDMEPLAMEPNQVTLTTFNFLLKYYLLFKILIQMDTIEKTKRGKSGKTLKPESPVQGRLGI